MEAKIIIGILIQDYDWDINIDEDNNKMDAWVPLVGAASISVDEDYDCDIDIIEGGDVDFLSMD